MWLNLQMNKKTKIGNIEIGNGVFLAPMEDVCDLPFRIVCKRLGADIVYTEFIAAEGIIRHSRKSKQKMTVVDEERPVAVQIFGENIESMIESAKIVEDAGADILDINFGCWVKKVVRREAGAAFLKKPDEMAELTRKVAEAVSIPVTVKTRLGWDHDSIDIVRVSKMLEEAGAKALAVHCRTRDMGMTGEADWTWGKKIKEAIDIPFILNGDVNTPEDAKRAFEQTNCDAVMIGRSAIGYPFIFQQVKNYLETGEYQETPDIYTRADICLQHLQMTSEYKGDRGIVAFRKHYSGYFKGFFGASELRSSLMAFKEFDPIKDTIDKYIKYLEDNDRLEPISKTRHHAKLSCDDSKYVRKQTMGV
jgi:tRNA-dihydrouridine synthase B